MTIQLLPTRPTGDPKQLQRILENINELIKLIKPYSVGTFTATLTGVSGSVTGTAFYELNGETVNLLLPGLSGTSNATSCTITGLPAEITPTRDQGLAHPVIADNGVFALGTAIVRNTGEITIYDDDIGTSATNWTNSGTKTVVACNYTYLLI
jgi:hypothetical protein